MKECPHCEYHKERAARWRAEAYKQAGHDVIELPWVGLTDEEKNAITWGNDIYKILELVEAKLRSKNT